MYLKLNYIVLCVRTCVISVGINIEDDDYSYDIIWDVRLNHKRDIRE